MYLFYLSYLFLFLVKKRHYTKFSTVVQTKTDYFYLSTLWGKYVHWVFFQSKLHFNYYILNLILTKTFHKYII